MGSFQHGEVDPDEGDGQSSFGSWLTVLIIGPFVLIALCGIVQQVTDIRHNIERSHRNANSRPVATSNFVAQVSVEETINPD